MSKNNIRYSYNTDRSRTESSSTTLGASVTSSSSDCCEEDAVEDDIIVNDATVSTTNNVDIDKTDEISMNDVITNDEEAIVEQECKDQCCQDNNSHCKNERKKNKFLRLKRTVHSKEECELVRKEKELFVPPLMLRAYHLPGYTYKEDMVQYLTNTHPVIGICWHHPLHPVNFWERILALIGSTLFGLAITNMIYLIFVFADVDYNETYIQIPATNFTKGMAIASLLEQSAPSALSVTNGNIALWTIGSAVHALYDNLIWKLASCACCLKDGMSLVDRHDNYGYRGTLLVVMSVVGVVALATFVVTLRKALDNASSSSTSNEHNGTDRGNLVDVIHNIRIYQKKTSMNDNSTISSNGTYPDDQQFTLYAEVNDSLQPLHDLQFLIAFGIELILNYFVYYPVVGIIMFSGIVTCRTGKYELCGGRPYEIRQVEAEEYNKTNNITTEKRLDDSNNDDGDNDDDDGDDVEK
jgi:hypothetical protein